MVFSHLVFLPKATIRPNMKIDKRIIGDDNPSYVIAEVGLAHEGSLGLAYRFVDAIADAGADAVKFQTHISEAESTIDEAFRVKFSYQDGTRWDYWQRTGFTAEQWHGLAAYCEKKKVTFLSSPFSVQAVDILDKIGMPAFKIASGNLGNPDMLSAIYRTGKPVIFSSGLSSWEDLVTMSETVRSYDIDAAILQCTSKYPAPLSEVGLNVIARIESELRLLSGISDHSGTIFPSMASMAQGHAFVEVHVVLDKGMFGPDVPASLTMAELKQLCDARDAFFEMRAPVDKNETAAKASKMRALFGWSLALQRPLKQGEVIAEDNLCLKKPGSGLPNSERASFIGKQVVADVPANRLLRLDDV